MLLAPRSSHVFNLLAGCVLLAFWHNCSLRAADFDCTKANTVAERKICSDAELSQLDEELAVAYSNALGAFDPKAVKKEQREWLKARDRCLSGASCLAASQLYKDRILQLQTFISNIERHPPDGPLYPDNYSLTGKSFKLDMATLKAELMQRATAFCIDKFGTATFPYPVIERSSFLSDANRPYVVELSFWCDH